VQVIALSTPGNPAWRWRIVSYSGEHVEESREEFGTIAVALAKGAKRLREMNVVDRSVPVPPHRSVFYPRGR
jgi:hypothetical protein